MRRTGHGFLAAGAFLAVAEQGTFTRAAERVCRTQLAVSQSIRKLEDELGTALFARDGHEVSLTEAGRTLVESARKMIDSRSEIVRQLGAFKNLTGGTLDIATRVGCGLFVTGAGAPT